MTVLVSVVGLTRMWAIRVVPFVGERASLLMSRTDITHENGRKSCQDAYKDVGTPTELRGIGWPVGPRPVSDTVGDGLVVVTVCN